VTVYHIVDFGTENPIITRRMNITATLLFTSKQIKCHERNAWTISTSASKHSKSHVTRLNTVNQSSAHKEQATLTTVDPRQTAW